MSDTWTRRILLMLLITIVALMVAILGIFIRVNQLQAAVIQAFGAQTAQEGLAIGSRAPSFSLSARSGEVVSSESLKGHPFLLIFAAPSCSFCQQMYPELVSFRASHRALSILMLSRGSEVENDALIQKYGFDFPVLAWSEEVATAYRVMGTPFLCYVDAAGNIEKVGYADLLKDIAEIAAK